MQKKFSEIFSPMYRDGKLLLIVLAALLATISIIASYLARIPYYSFEKTLLVGIPFAFAWLVLAWVITDQSVLRRPLPYVIIFIVLFFEKIYWSLFYYLFPPDYISLFSDSNGFNIIAEGWWSLYENAYYFYILVMFIVMFVVFFVLWYLAKPKEYKQKQTTRVLLLIVSAFLMTLPFWIWRLIYFISGSGFLEFLAYNFEMIQWLNLLFYGLPIAFAMIIFGFVITNIKAKSKYILYLLIGIFSFLPYGLIYSDIMWFKTSTFWTLTFYFIVVGVSYFMVFISLVLLSKARYIEQ